MVRIQSEHFVQQLPCPAFLAEGLPRSCRVEPSLGVRRMKTESCIECGDGLLRSTEAQEETALVAVREIPTVRRAADRSVVVRECLIHPAQGSQDVRAKEECLGVGRLDSSEDGQAFLRLADRLEDSCELALRLRSGVDVHRFPEEPLRVPGPTQCGRRTARGEPSGWIRRIT